MDVIGDLLRSQKLTTNGLGTRSFSAVRIPLTGCITVDPNDKRKLLCLESELWQNYPGYDEPPMGGHELLSWSISRINILAAHHRLDTIGSVDGEKSDAILLLAQTLAKGDPDVLRALLTDFEDIIYQWRRQGLQAARIGISFLLSIISEASMQDVKAVAMSKLGSILSSHNDTTEYMSIPHFDIRPQSFFDWSQSSVYSSPQLADGAIRLQGALLSRLAQTDLTSFTDSCGGIGCGVNPLERWTRTLGLAGKERNVSCSITPGVAWTKI